ncbi:hypothetical protein AB0F96_09970 [Streptomyces sp. NPDC023998]|uniref:hypothetical protein n=1 Tax=Streptomyces sp. NPDC023998 TaxID=3154597 RepID=UPI0033FD2BFD
MSAAATDPTTGLVRSAREAVPAHLWDKQIGLLMRHYLYDSARATPTCSLRCSTGASRWGSPPARDGERDDVVDRAAEFAAD